MQPYQIWQVCWQVAIFVTPFLLGAVVLWLNSQYVKKTDAIVERNRIDALLTAYKGEISAAIGAATAEVAREKAESDQRYEVVRDRLADHEGRVRATEDELKRPPTRHTLNTEVTKVIASNLALEKAIDAISRQMEAAVKGVSDQLGTNNSYLQVLIEKGMHG